MSSVSLLQFSPSATFFDVEGIPVSLDAGASWPLCAAWDTFPPRRFSAHTASNGARIPEERFRQLLAEQQWAKRGAPCPQGPPLTRDDTPAIFDLAMKLQWRPKLRKILRDALAGAAAIDDDTTGSPGSPAADAPSSPMQGTGRSTRYYDGWEGHVHDCAKCSWSGPGAALEMGDIFDGVTEMVCPRCNEKVLNLAQPTVEEVRANWGKASEFEKVQVELGDLRGREFERRKLSSASQLPDIDAPAFVLIVDDLDGSMERVIKHGDRVIHAEPRYWEDWRRYIELATIVREKYGDQVLDLVPTRDCYANLWGDSLGSPHAMNEARERLFGPRAPVDGGSPYP